MPNDPYTPKVIQPDGMMYRRPWELTSETLAQLRVEDEHPLWEPPLVSSQVHDPMAGADPNTWIKPVRNTKSLNRAFNGAEGTEAPMSHEEVQYMVPPRFGWRSEELGLEDIMMGVMTKLGDPTNPAKVGYLDDWSGQNTGGGYQGTEQYSHGEIPQGL